MRRIGFASICLLTFGICKGQDLWVANEPRRPITPADTGAFYFNPYSSAFFDNKEFTSDIKKGYTYPGFFVQPQLMFQPSSRTRLTAGIHTQYFAGTDSVERLVPVLRLEVTLFEGTNMVLGTIHSKQAHYLPEPLFKPERLLVWQPETGVQFITETKRFRADSWTNWERYIKHGSPFREEFTMGFSALIKPNTFRTREGLMLSICGFGVHNGGQIDSCERPVTTLINLAAGLSYSLPVGSGKTSVGVEATGFLSSDKSPNPSSKYRDGKALYPKVFIEGGGLRGELGYWRASKFTNPRGEELFGSYSTVDTSFDSPRRTLYTVKVIYSVPVAKGFTLGARVDTYFDPDASIFDWAFTFRMCFDRDILIRR